MDNEKNTVDVTAEETQTQEETTQIASSKENQPEEKLLKQSDVNNIVARETKSAQEKLLKELGIDDFENAKDGMAKFKKWQDEQKTEEERKDEKLENLTKKSKQDDEKIASLNAKLTALTLGVKEDSLDDVITLASTKVTEEVDIKTAIESVLEKYPHFSKSQEKEEEKKPSMVNPGNNVGSSKVSDVIDKALEKYKKRY